MEASEPVTGRMDDGAACPSTTDLLHLNEGALGAAEASALRAHIDYCPSCGGHSRNLMAHNTDSRKWPAKPDPTFGRALAEQAAIWMAARPPDAPIRPGVGHLWSTHAPDQTTPAGESVLPRIVFVLGELTEEGPLFTVAPISLERTYATNWDLLVEQEGGGLGYPYMIEVWNVTVVLRSQLVECLAAAVVSVRRAADHLHDAHLGEGDSADPVFGKRGSPIFSRRDPRAAFQRREREACAYLRAPYAAWVAEREQESSIDVGVLPLNGQAIRAARQRAQLEIAEVADKLILQLGRDVQVSKLRRLEETTSADTPADEAAALATILGVTVGAIRAESPSTRVSIADVSGFDALVNRYARVKHRQDIESFRRQVAQAFDLQRAARGDDSDPADQLAHLEALLKAWRD
jgi:hypothetical protein